MKRVWITDITLVATQENKPTFREKLEYVSSLDSVKIDGIDIPAIEDKADALFVKTAAEQVKNATLICNAGKTEESIAATYEAIRGAQKPCLQIALPVSPVQIEYHCNVKPPKLAEIAVALVKKCKEYLPNVEFKALDAFRADADFVNALLKEIANAGATSIVLVDLAGNLPTDDFVAKLNDCTQGLPENVMIGVEASNEMGMGYANCIAACKGGAQAVKTTVFGKACPKLERTFQLLTSAINAQTGLDVTKLHATVEKIRNYAKMQRSNRSPFDFGVKEQPALALDKSTTAEEVKKAASALGYDLGEEDLFLIYDQFKRIANKKAYVGAKELEVIIANASLQVPQTYRLISYVINSGNLITPTAVVKLEKDGQQIMGVSVGDGPVDAGILAIEKAIGCHYELDDYQITAVTEGREAMGSAIVKLRAYGKIFSGTGLSTDVIGASIRAYVSAINKIAYEEN